MNQICTKAFFLTLFYIVFQNVSVAQHIQSIQVGQHYEGGVIAYILQPGEPGYVHGQSHGIIASIHDLSNEIPWQIGNTMEIGVNSTLIGTGLFNSNIIVSAVELPTQKEYAAFLCKNYRGGNHSDWYLPSLKELELLYKNRIAIGMFNLNHSYWSSSEYNANDAWSLNFFNGNHYNNGKKFVFAVRAVRSF